LGTTIGNASYAFTVPALSNFVVVVESSGSTASSQFSGTVSGFYDQTSGPGVCPAAPTAPTLTGAVSRLHGFDVAIPTDGTLVTEPRNGAGNYQVILTFDAPVQSGNATVSSGTGTPSSVSFSGNNMIVNLTGVTDAQVLALTATGVTGTNGGVLSSATMNLGFLVGDSSGNGTVSASDVAQVKSQSGQPLTQANARLDANNDGSLSSSDVALVKSRSGNTLP